MASRTIRLAVIGGDGIGPEVVAEALKVLRVAAPDVTIEETDYDLGARRWHRTGETLPDAVLEEIRGHEAILLGAVGDPTVPSVKIERGLLLRLRFELDYYVNLRPGRGAIRAQVDVVIELEAQPQQQAALEHAARHGRVAHRAKQDRLVAPDLLEHRVGQRFPVRCQRRAPRS